MLAGKSALVTGASSGIGEATATALAAEGANVAIAARREGRLESLADRLESDYDCDVAVLPTDVSDAKQVGETVERTVAEFGGLDVVVPNAGVGRTGDLEEMSLEDYRTMVDVNVDGVFYTTKESLPHLRESEGTIVFVGSYGAKFPYPYNPVYGGTKFFTRGFAQSVAARYGDSGIGVSIVNPSAVRTEYGSEFRTANKDRWEPGEVTEAEEVADAIVFAATQEPPNTVNELDLFKRDIFG